MFRFHYPGIFDINKTTKSDLKVGIDRWKVFQCNSISNPAFWFLLVSEPQKLIKTDKTDKNQETGKLGNPGPISQKPHC